MAARTIAAVMDRIEYEHRMTSGDIDAAAGHNGPPEPEEPMWFTLIVKDLVIGEVVTIRCKDRAEVEQVIAIIHEDGGEKTHSIDMADHEVDALSIFQDRWEQADREMGDPNP